MRNREAIQPRQIEIVVVDVVLNIADNNDSIVKRDIVKVPPGSIENGEYIIVILSIPGRTHRSFNIGYLKHRGEEVCQSKDLQPKLDK